jgi:macrolide-specific efflux system membrane fusion protein
MRRTRRQWLINAGLAVVLAVVAGVGLFLASDRSASGTEASSVRTVAVRTGDVTASVSADGSVEPVNEVAANFETSGTIARLRVEVGDTVTKGEVIATLEKADARRAVTVARLQLDAAQEQLDSAEEGTTTTDPQSGKSTTSVSSSQVASAKAQVVQAQATLDDAEAELDATTLTAPISGTVLQVNGKVGSSAGSSSSQASSAAGASTATSTDLVLIANLKALQVSVSVPESDIGSLEVGQKATVTFPAVDDAEATGTITSIDPVATTSNSVVTYGVVVRLSGVPSTVRLGQSASVTVTTASATGVLVVPSAAVTTNGDRSTVAVLTDGQQAPAVVTLGVVGDAWTEVTDGVTAGDQVVLTTSASTSTTTGFPGGGFPGGGLPGGGLPAGGGGGLPAGVGGP